MNQQPADLPVMERLHQQIGFILEIDKLKLIIRRTLLIDRSRRENDAEHSWHLAMMALVLAEYAEPGVDIGRVKIGRATCRERVWQYVSIWVVAGSFIKKRKKQ